MIGYWFTRKSETRLICTARTRWTQACSASIFSRFLLNLCLSCLSSIQCAQAQPANSSLDVIIADAATRTVVPCSIRLKDSAGQAVLAMSLPHWRDHFDCDGKFHMQLPEGNYSYEIDRGPEYLLSTGAFRISEGKPTKIAVELKRFIDLTTEGWWSGDLHVHRSLTDIELLMRAEDLHVAPVMTWWNNKNQWANQPMPEKLLVQFDRNRFYHVMAGEDEREGGALMFFNLRQPLPLAGSAREYPSPMRFVKQARSNVGIWIDVEKPFWWDVPIWLASGEVDSIGLANNHMCRNQMYENEAWGRPRDVQRLPSPLGNGFWTQEIYYHILNCGLRIPPSAGSASGVLPNPVGYNRVYVHLGNEMAYEKWWKGLREGRSFVSNGPLLRCRVNGEYPGHVFKATEGNELRLKIDAALDGRDPVSGIEIIKNGRVESTVPIELGKTSGRLATLSFFESGWFLVRVIAKNSKTFRFASTAPYYVEIGASKHRISKHSAQFFLDWVRERSQQVKLDDPGQRQEVLQYHKMAEKFWQNIMAQANAD